MAQHGQDYLGHTRGARWHEHVYGESLTEQRLMVKKLLVGHSFQTERQLTDNKIIGGAKNPAACRSTIKPAGGTKNVTRKKNQSK